MTSEESRRHHVFLVQNFGHNKLHVGLEFRKIYFHSKNRLQKTFTINGKDNSQNVHWTILSNPTSFNINYIGSYFSNIPRSKHKNTVKFRISLNLYEVG